MRLFSTISLLLLGLSACSTPTGPDGSHIYGPQVQVVPYRAECVITYSVEGYQPHYPGNPEFLNKLAYQTVEADGQYRRYTVVFTDATTGGVILQSKFTLEPDLLGQNKVHREY